MQEPLSFPGFPSDALPPETRSLSPEERRTVRRCLTLLGVLSAGSMTGVAASLYMVNHAPLLLIALSPLGRHLVLVAPLVDPVAFVVVAVARRLLFYFACYRLGRALGPVGVIWLEARAARAALFVRWLERLFARASHAVVLVMAGPTVSALAGSTGMPARTYVPLVSLGLVARVLLVLGLAAWLREPIEALLALIDEYWIPGTVVIATGIALEQWRRRRALALRER
jgi:membrane protein DedA with SNARE-associated domain